MKAKQVQVLTRLLNGESYRAIKAEKVKAPPKPNGQFLQLASALKNVKVQ